MADQIAAIAAGTAAAVAIEFVVAAVEFVAFAKFSFRPFAVGPYLFRLSFSAEPMSV